MRIKVKGERRTYRYYDCSWVACASLSDPHGANGGASCDYKLGPHDFWGSVGGSVYYARYTHTHTQTVASRAESLIARMNVHLSEEEWKNHWVYKSAVKILWEEFYWKQDTSDHNLKWKTSKALHQCIAEATDRGDTGVIDRCNEILAKRNGTAHTP